MKNHTPIHTEFGLKSCTSSLEKEKQQFETTPPTPYNKWKKGTIDSNQYILDLWNTETLEEKKIHGYMHC